MSDHLNEVTALSIRLTAMGEELKEYLVVAMLFSSLLESYGSLVTALDSRPEEDLTLEFVKGKSVSYWMSGDAGRNARRQKKYCEPVVNQWGRHLQERRLRVTTAASKVTTAVIARSSPRCQDSRMLIRRNRGRR